VAHKRRRSAGIPQFVLGGILITAVAGCSGYTPAKVQSEYGPGVKFSGLGSSYDWVPGIKDKSGDALADSPYLHDLIRQLVEEDLAAKGFTKKTSGSADFWVEYRVARRLRNQTDPADLQYAEGSLVLYVIDPATRKWIWRSFAEARLQESNPPDVKKARLEATLRQMLKTFPTKDGQPSGANRPGK
jgi:hypothetical protein